MQAKSEKSEKSEGPEYDVDFDVKDGRIAVPKDGAKHKLRIAGRKAYLFAFLHHHGFLVLGDAPTWHTVVGGSRAYVAAITDRLDVVQRDQNRHCPA